MYLKQLDLSGFKTFAGHTEFTFNSGVTAIVGPNGCGKSNVADAIRWVLGEQSVRWLRAKKAEDLIYAGSSSRAPLGMAEVTLTLDNSQGWLPIPYNEVAITRRAYRSGENEYLINRQRVRYRDVADLLAKSGLGPGSYTVIGQGLVDAVLSLRPEERRGLFEDAANIRHYYHKLNEAKSKLEQTEQNATRVNDIIAELLPRLKDLEAQATQAQRHATLMEQLTRLLKIHYVHLWQQTSETVNRTLDEERHCERLLIEQKSELDRVCDRLEHVRQAQRETRVQLSLWKERYFNLRSTHADLNRRLAVNNERLSAYQRQSEELSHEIAALTQQIVSTETEISEAEKQAADMILERGRLMGDLRVAEERLESKQRERQKALSRLNSLHTESVKVSTSIAGLRSKIEHAVERQNALEADLARNRESSQRRKREAEQMQAEKQTVAAGIGQLDRELEKTEAAWQETQRLLSQSLISQQAIDESISERSRQCQELQTRIELISKWEQSYSGYYSGVKNVLQSARPGAGITRLSGIVGVAGQLIQASPEMETAIEVALGSHVQDIVVERWEDAERAISLLKRTSGGRATFLPLDTIRRVASARAFTPRPGVLGLASELVRHEPRYQAVVSYLLGNTIVVQDLMVARQVLGHCGPGWQIVTLAGELVRSSGAVTGGSTTTASGILTRQRELRELPKKLAEIELQLKETRAKLVAEKQRHRDLLAVLSKHESQHRQLAASRQSRMERCRELENALERLRAEDRWAQEQEKQAIRELDELESAQLLWAEELQRVSANSETTLQTAGTVQAEVAQLQQDEATLSAKVSEAKTSVAVANERIQSQQETIKRLQTSLTATQRQVETKKSRLSELASSIQALLSDAEAAESELTTVSDEMDSLGSMMQPAELNLVQLEAENSTLVAREARIRAAIQETQATNAEIALRAQRARDDLEALKIRIEGDLGSAEFFAEGDQSLQEAQVNLDDLKREIAALRDQLRKLPQVNPLAVEEYQQTLERHRFLSEQLNDLQRGAQSIRRVINELQRTMTRRFEETFKAVGIEFQHYFRVLFGEGTARLRLTEPADISQTGVEIIVQPPGRKQQNLSLLSGGERALTAVSLLFALLKVNPSPICVLDEVDAALDETNVARFCSTLKDLAVNTQFIVITHNRGTMETAETLYGISMPDNSISRVVSLRFSGEETPEPQFASAS